MAALNITVLFCEYEENGARRHDKVVEQVAGALSAAGHRPGLLAVANELRALVERVAAQKPDLVFNLCESFADNDRLEPNIAAVLEVLGRPFTGTGSSGLTLQQDKVLTKKLLAFHKVRCPQYAIIGRKSIEFAAAMSFPLFVKPVRSEASIGISAASLVKDYASLNRQVSLILRTTGEPALVEEYIEGREFYVGVLGNRPMEALPLIELDFSRLKNSRAKIYDHAAKYVETSEAFRLTREIVATDLPPETRSRITLAGLEAARALQVRDYARVDLRLAADGTPYVVEVNANPYLEEHDTLARAATQAGMNHAALIARIVEEAMERNAPQPAKPTPQAGRSRRGRSRPRAS